jgi:large conductance mechanosensitive channel
MLKEFRSFIERGNVIDLAVAVIIGGAFGKIVSSVVADVLMPPIGLLLGGMNFTSLKLAIGGKPEAPVTLNYGNFLQATFDFLIIAFCVFLLVKTITAMKKKQEEAPAAPPAPPEDVVLLREIRDLLKQGK